MQPIQHFLVITTWMVSEKMDENGPKPIEKSITKVSGVQNFHTFSLPQNKISNSLPIASYQKQPIQHFLLITRWTPSEKMDENGRKLMENPITKLWGKQNFHGFCLPQSKISNAWAIGSYQKQPIQHFLLITTSTPSEKMDENGPKPIENRITKLEPWREATDKTKIFGV